MIRMVARVHTSLVKHCQFLWRRRSAAQKSQRQKAVQDGDRSSSWSTSLSGFADLLRYQDSPGTLTVGCPTTSGLCQHHCHPLWYRLLLVLVLVLPLYTQFSLLFLVLNLSIVNIIFCGMLFTHIARSLDPLVLERVDFHFRCQSHTSLYCVIINTRSLIPSINAIVPDPAISSGH